MSEKPVPETLLYIEELEARLSAAEDTRDLFELAMNQEEKLRLEVQAKLKRAEAVVEAARSDHLDCGDDCLIARAVRRYDKEW